MQVNRAPMRMPIEVVYDSDTHNIKVTGDTGIEAEVFFTMQTELLKVILQP